MQSSALSKSRMTSNETAEIKLENVHKSFEGRKILNGITVSIRRGEIVAIVGGSGSGKTVLMRHILGHFMPDSGNVLVADHELEGAPLVDLSALDESQLDHLRRHWAVVFQRNALFSGSVYENIALALREVKGLPEDEIQKRATRVLTAVGLNVNSVMQLDRDELSGGMAKRVAIARALALEPLLLFYDEPTTGLDPQMAEQIQNLILENHQQSISRSDKHTTLIITHDKDLLHRLRPRVVMLHQGKIFFDGTYEAFNQSDSPEVRPYLDRMDSLHYRKMQE